MSTDTLTDEQRTHLAEFRRDVAEREQAQTIAWDRLVSAVETVQQHLRDRNYGLADDVVSELLDEQLPNDHGGPVTHFPLMERALAEVVARRAE